MSGIIPFSLKVDQLWHQRYGTPLRLVGGEHISDWLLFYSPSRPKTITPWSNRTEPNIYNSEIRYAEIAHFGALLIGDSVKNCTDTSFSKALTQWPQIKLDAISQITFHPDKQWI